MTERHSKYGNGEKIHPNERCLFASLLWHTVYEILTCLLYLSILTCSPSNWLLPQVTVFKILFDTTGLSRSIDCSFHSRTAWCKKKNLKFNGCYCSLLGGKKKKFNLMVVIVLSIVSVEFMGFTTLNTYQIA